MVAVQNYHGNPAPPGKPVLTFQIGDVMELLRGDPDSPWWEVRVIPPGKLLKTPKPGTSALSLDSGAFLVQGCAGVGRQFGACPQPCPVLPVLSQSDAQLGPAGEAAADEEVRLFPQLLSEALPRGCQGKCQTGDGAGTASWVGLSLSLFSAFSSRPQSFPGPSARPLPHRGGGSLLPWCRVIPALFPRLGLASSFPALFLL